MSDATARKLERELLNHLDGNDQEKIRFALELLGPIKDLPNMYLGTVDRQIKDSKYSVSLNATAEEVNGCITVDQGTMVIVVRHADKFYFNRS
jgi:hypothetical protein